MPIQYLDKKSVVALNQIAVRLSKDPHGVINEGNLDYLVDAMKYKYTGEGEEVLLKSAFLLDYLANKGHIFIEGNKRTAEIATILFLVLNKWQFSEEDQLALANFVLSVAKGERSLSFIAKWLKERIKAR